MWLKLHWLRLQNGNWIGWGRIAVLYNLKLNAKVVELNREKKSDEKLYTKFI